MAARKYDLYKIARHGMAATLVRKDVVVEDGFTVEERRYLAAHLGGDVLVPQSGPDAIVYGFNKTRLAAEKEENK